MTIEVHTGCTCTHSGDFHDQEDYCEVCDCERQTHYVTAPECKHAHSVTTGASTQCIGCGAQRVSGGDWRDLPFVQSLKSEIESLRASWLVSRANLPPHSAGE